jgi:hypothetical protein
MFSPVPNFCGRTQRQRTLDGTVTSGRTQGSKEHPGKILDDFSCGLPVPKLNIVQELEKLSCKGNNRVSIQESHSRFDSEVRVNAMIRVLKDPEKIRRVNDYLRDHYRQGQMKEE